jgi:hypothetical protein
MRAERRKDIDNRGAVPPNHFLIEVNARVFTLSAAANKSSITELNIGSATYFVVQRYPSDQR